MRGYVCAGQYASLGNTINHRKRATVQFLAAQIRIVNDLSRQHPHVHVIAKRWLLLGKHAGKRNSCHLVRCINIPRNKECVDHRTEAVVKNELAVRALVQELLGHRLYARLALHLACVARHVILGIVDAERLPLGAIVERNGIGE